VAPTRAPGAVTADAPACEPAVASGPAAVKPVVASEPAPFEPEAIELEALEPEALELAQTRWPPVEQSRRELLLVPVGSLEQHGPHLPLDTDTRIAVAVARRACLGRRGVALARMADGLNTTIDLLLEGRPG
jgi:Creatinine amidohydrolase